MEPCSYVGNRPKRSSILSTVIIVLTLFGPAILILFVASRTEKQKRTIRVGDQTCSVEFVVTGRDCTSTGDCTDRGYDKAVCPDAGVD